MSRNSYHHGQLRETLLHTAAALIAERGPTDVSMREIARAAGVSHAAPVHHFGDRCGLLTALAAEGFTTLTGVLSAAQPDFLSAATGYVRFATQHPGHYRVMFDRSLVRTDDAELAAAMTASRNALAAGIATLPNSVIGDDPSRAALAAFSLVHGFATLWLNAALPAPLQSCDALDLTRQIATLLFPPNAAS